MTKAIATANGSTTFNFPIIKGETYLVEYYITTGDYIDKYWNIYNLNKLYMGTIRKEWLMLLATWREEQINNILDD